MKVVCRTPARAQPTDLAGIEAMGAAWWPLRMARELDDAILTMRTNELDIGAWLLKTEGDAQAVLAVDATYDLNARWSVGGKLARRTRGGHRGCGLLVVEVHLVVVKVPVLI